MDEFPSNTHKEKDQPEKAKKVEQIVEGAVTRRKTPLGKKLKETFIGGDAKTVWSYVFFDVMMPAAKDMIVDAGSQGIERMMFGEAKRGPRSRAGGSTGFVSYNRYSSPVGAGARREDPRRDLPRRSRASHDFDDIVLESRAEAEQVVDRLFDLVSQFGRASVADLYDLVGITGTFADDKWGWPDLRGSGVSRVRNGYLLDLPRPEPID